MTDAMEIITTDETTDIQPRGIGVDAVQSVVDYGYFATFETESMKGKKKLFSVTRDSESLKNYMETPLTIKDIVFSTVTVTSDDTGEQSATLAVYLICDDGVSYMSSSKGVCNSAIELLNVFGEPSTWDESITVICSEKTTARGNRYKYLYVE